ncbi:MAG: hypothetical protein E5V58_29495 [Mesorhizobium sp.]|uniref:Uncharacterized protein n=1 Tax=Mesorhizobium abyssinicae TaxID=1209958 RepID=A0ABU5AU79_9HYPH|nr:MULTISPECIES: hypothetical protein [Mesorhizobium]MDX8540852.1 hypothetical protein [Mesorhizobium abyssinicae]RWC96344.1 MAG: hypothetical protein EOS32_08970 [Mesorhizobium sp.]TIW66772.1 MAG: hypothetical protein E5V58_29495 [Mesorhizobium sp.]
MRFVPATMSRRQRLGQLAGRLFVNVVAALIAGVAILLLVLSTHHPGAPTAPPQILTTTAP